MPRAPRKKSAESMYHIMCRSISERDMFQCDEDKSYYLKLLKRFKERYKCKIYAYCLMDNHVHIYINPCGYDISTFMLSLNTAYVTYHNKRYQRHGHLLQGRFASTIVDNSTYSITLSAYIHNNAKDLEGHAGKEEDYRYSSYDIYTGQRRDTDGMVDVDFILNLFSKDRSTAQQKYRKFVQSMRDTGIMKEIDDSIIKAYTENCYTGEKREIARQKTPEQIIKKLGEVLQEKLSERLLHKYSRDASKVRALAVYSIRILCGYTYKKICEYLGDITLSGISRLSNEGFRLVSHYRPYQEAFRSLTLT